MAPNPDQRPFPFLSLPPELRDQVYTHLLSTRHTIDIFRYQKRFTCTKSSDSNEENPEGVHIPVDILRTCRQIHAEATPILYSSSRLVFTFPRVFTGFLMRTRAARWMKDIEIRYPCHRVDVLEALKALDRRVEKLERLALGSAIRKVFGARELSGELLGLVRKMGGVNGDRSSERTLSRIAFVPDVGYSTRTVNQMRERDRVVYEEEVKGLLKRQLEDDG